MKVGFLITFIHSFGFNQIKKVFSPKLATLSSEKRYRAIVRKLRAFFHLTEISLWHIKMFDTSYLSLMAPILRL